MSALREALERIESNRAGRAADSRSVPAAPAVTSVRPPQIEPTAVEAAWIATPLSIGGSTQSSPSASERTPLDDAALAISRNFAANSSLVVVGCDLSLPLAVLAASLAEALRRQAEAAPPIRLEVLAAADVASQAERLRAADGVLLAVELDRTLARAADVTAAVLRAQGVTIAGVIALR